MVHTSGMHFFFRVYQLVQQVSKQPLFFKKSWLLGYKNAQDMGFLDICTIKAIESALDNFAFVHKNVFLSLLS